MEMKFTKKENSKSIILLKAIKTNIIYQKGRKIAFSLIQPKFYHRVMIEIHGKSFICIH